MDTPLKDEGGIVREARTDFERLAMARLEIPMGRYPEARFSLLRVYPRSGRRHQIRRHLARIAHPILGDTSHGDHRVNRFQKEHLGSGRLMLHAQILTVAHPGDASPLTIEAGPDEDFRARVRALGFPESSLRAR